MVRLNKTPLSDKQLEELFTKLNETLGKLSAEQSKDFLSKLLGPEEQIMLAKRLAIIVMINEGYSQYKIADTLKVSTATAHKVQERVTSDGYNQLLPILKKDKKGYLAILETIDTILTFGGIMPHYGETHASEAYKRKQSLKE